MDQDLVCPDLVQLQVPGAKLGVGGPQEAAALRAVPRHEDILYVEVGQHQGYLLCAEKGERFFFCSAATFIKVFLTKNHQLNVRYHKV